MSKVIISLSLLISLIQTSCLRENSVILIDGHQVKISNDSLESLYSLNFNNSLKDPINPHQSNYQEIYSSTFHSSNPSDDPEDFEYYRSYCILLNGLIHQNQNKVDSTYLEKIQEIRKMINTFFYDYAQSLTRDEAILQKISLQSGFYVQYVELPQSKLVFIPDIEAEIKKNNREIQGINNRINKNFQNFLELEVPEITKFKENEEVPDISPKTKELLQYYINTYNLILTPHQRTVLKDMKLKLPNILIYSLNLSTKEDKSLNDFMVFLEDHVLIPTFITSKSLVAEKDFLLKRTKYLENIAIAIKGNKYAQNTDVYSTSTTAAFLLALNSKETVDDFAYQEMIRVFIAKMKTNYNIEVEIIPMRY